MLFAYFVVGESIIYIDAALLLAITVTIPHSGLAPFWGSGFAIIFNTDYLYGGQK